MNLAEFKMPINLKFTRSDDGYSNLPKDSEKCNIVSQETISILL